MNKAQRLQILIDSGKTVFSNVDLSTLWGTDVGFTKIIASRMAKEGVLSRLAHGIYTYRKEYNIFELANRLVTPSYISCHSALFDAGVCFQASTLTSSIALVHVIKRIKNETFKYFYMKRPLFFNSEGIVYKGSFSIATPERALLDSYYFGLLPSVDNPEKLNPKVLHRLSQFYPKTVQAKIKRLIDLHHL